MTTPDDGHDTTLARLLFEQGSIALGPLRACLEEVRRDRHTNPNASLAVALVGRGLAPQDVVDAAVRRVIPVEEGGAPRALGPYRIVRELARGGMGAVYEAVHSETGGHYALKTLLPGLLGEAGSEELDRFRREAEVMGQLNHPYVARIHAAELEERRPYLVQDLLTGGTLRARVLTRGVSADEAVALIEKLAEGLGHCHARGVFHRDLKPENVLIDERGEPKLVDFGLAKTLEASRRLTAPGSLLGTPGYMAPEQATGVGPTDARTDVYGLGGILYFLLSKRPPFDSEHMFEVLAQVVEDPPAPLTEAPPWLAAVCLRALAKDPAERYQDMAEFRQALHERAAPPPRRPPIALGLVAVGALLAAGLGVVLTREGQAPPEAPAAEPVRVSVAPVLSTVHGQRVSVGFRVQPEGAAVLLRVGAGAWRRLAQATDYREELELELGPNPVTIEARAPDGRREDVTVQIACLTPSWWAEQDEAERAPYPLPPGLLFGPEPRVFVHEKSGVELVYVPPGTFILGFNGIDGISIAGDNQVPPHVTHITRGFFFGRYELTRDEYRKFAADTGETLPPADYDDGRSPMVLSWHQAKQYCEWAGGLRLPTEAEWEYAAEGGDEARGFPWGNEAPGPQHCNVAGKADRFEFSSPVGSFPAGVSRWGSHDMSGNLWEWTQDVIRKYPRPNVELVDPVARGPGSRVIRGGGWRSEDTNQISSNFRFYAGARSGEGHERRDLAGLRAVLPTSR